MKRPDSDDYLQLFLRDVPMLDTRAPVEFARGAFANAVNLPLMTDEERHLVGSRYKQSGQESAIALGRELVTPQLQAERTAKWLTFTRQHPDGYLYCFRGGLRSRITQQWIAEAGVDYPYVTGGYKAMRRFLIDRFEDDITEGRFVLISGRTGTGKTLLLNQIRRSIDLEGLANHRGSSFGRMADPQPTPVQFENNLSVALLKLMEKDRTTRVWLEGEGRQVGSLSLPECLWKKMQQSPTLVLEADMARRVEIGLQDYVVDLHARIRKQMPGESGFEFFAERHLYSLEKIRRRLGTERYQNALGLLQEAIAQHRVENSIEGYKPFIALLLEHYYDPMYDYQLEKSNPQVLVRGDEQDLLQYLKDNDVELVN